MNDVTGGELVARGDLGLAGAATAKLTAFRKQAGAGLAMDGPVHAAAAQQRRIGGVDDGVNRLPGDVALHRGEVHAPYFSSRSTARSSAACRSSTVLWCLRVVLEMVMPSS